MKPETDSNNKLMLARNTATGRIKSRNCVNFYGADMQAAKQAGI